MRQTRQHHLAPIARSAVDSPGVRKPRFSLTCSSTALAFSVACTLVTASARLAGGEEVADSATVSPPARAGAADTLIAPPARAGAADTLVVRSPGHAGVADTVHVRLPGRPGVADTVTILPPVHVEGIRSVAPGRITATAVRLDRAGLTRFLPLTASDALATVPGVDLVKTGPWASRLSMRGLSGDRVLVLVDGVRINTVRGHGVQTSLIAPERLDAVEVLPGASSAQFGSDAMGGVVNFVTHAGLVDQPASGLLTLAARGAEPGRGWSQSGRVRMTGPRFGLELAGSVGGLRALHTPSGEVPNSGDRENDFSVRISTRWRAALFDLEHGHHAALDVGLPAFNNTAGATGSYPLQGRDVERLEMSVAGARARPEARLLAVVQNYPTDFTETTVDSVFLRGRFVASRTTVAADRIRTRTQGVQPALQFAGPGHLRLSGEYRRETTGGPRTTGVTVADASGIVTSQTSSSGESVPPAWREAWSGGAYVSHTLKGTRLEGGARYDLLRSHADSTANSSTSKLDATDRRWSFEGGLGHAFGPVEPYGHVASGFRAPNLEERYFNDDIHGGMRLFGNPDLNPEHSLSWEAGVRVTDAFGGKLRSARASAFRSEVRDLITFEYIGMLYLIPRFQYVNVKRARLEGLEATAELRARGVQMGLNAALPRAVDSSSGERIPDAGAARASIEVVVPARAILPQGTMSLRLRWNDAIKDVDPTLQRPAFWTTSVEAACLVSGVRGVFAIHNLWNHSYREPLSFIPEPGRTFAFSLRRDFGIPVPFTKANS